MSSNLLLSSLTVFYKKHPAYRKALKEIIEGHSVLSLRIIDWFVTHYSRLHQVIYWIDTEKNKYYEKYPENGNSNIKKFHLYTEYRAQLQSYTKLFFDPFRRHERITFILETDPLVSIETTVGQLNFFRWAFQNHIFNYINENLETIENTMAQYQKQIKKQTLPSDNPLIAIPVQASVQASATTSASASAPAYTQNVNVNVKTKEGKKLKKKDTHLGNIVLKAPCFIRFD
jgi:hypothetical protein